MQRNASSISIRFKEKAVSAYENGEGTLEEIANRFSIGMRTLQEWLVLKRETSELDQSAFIGIYQEYVKLILRNNNRSFSR